MLEAGYAKFVQRLNTGIEGRIAGYSEDESGCILHLSRSDSIRVASGVVSKMADEAIPLLREYIRRGVRGSLALDIVAGQLAFREAGDAAD